MAQQDVEHIGVEIVGQSLEVAGCDTDAFRNTLLLHRNEGIDRAALSAPCRKIHVQIGVVQMQQLEPLDTQSLEALLGRSAHPVAREIVRFWIGINLGGKDFARRDPTQFTNDLADRPLRSPLPIIVGRIGKIQRAGKERTHRVERASFIDGVAVKIGRTA